MCLWAYEDAPGTLAKARSLTDPAQQKSAMRAVLETWANSDPDAVLAWAVTAGGEEREVTLLHGSLQKADKDPAAGADIVSQLLAQNAGGDAPHIARGISGAGSGTSRSVFNVPVLSRRGQRGERLVPRL